MGTMVSLAVAGGPVPGAGLARLTALFTAWDDRYSLYRPASELSRIASGELSLLDASDHLRDSYRIALDWRDRTDGDFSPHRPDGVLDLSGVVKALAMAEAAAALLADGFTDWSLDVGGDILVHGDATPGQPWVVGIVDPDDRSALLTAIELDAARPALATSGSAERGDHIWRARRAADEGFRQVSVRAADIVTADVLATTIVAGGPAALDRVTERWPVDVATVSPSGEIRMTPGMRAAMERAATTSSQPPAAR
ncbi:FAD:protein FMN transferase [Galbitalea soli]|uniref:FAD:protein FMN transferase n=2 Tax=Galbitalea soli TaxID=1268042 RepID=A0A7C9TPK1_9MICO|nr:FAD:protein FMN transferase [Galbitalea soli]